MIESEDSLKKYKVDIFMKFLLSCNIATVVVESIKLQLFMNERFNILWVLSLVAVNLWQSFMQGIRL